MGDVEIKPLTPATWEAFAALAQKHNGVWGWCWCTYFHPAFPEKRQSAEGNRDLKRSAHSGPGNGRCATRSAARGQHDLPYRALSMTDVAG